MLFSRFTTMGTSQCTKPAYLLSLVTLTISLTFAAFILAGCTTPTPGLRKFTLITLTYGDKSTKSALLKNVGDILDGDKGNATFQTLRVGYRGVCIETTTGKDKDSSWKCAGTGSEIYGSDLGGDPIDLVSIGDVYKDKISFSTPLIVSAIFLGIAWLCIAVNCIPVIPIPAVTRKIAAVSASAGTLLFCGAMVLQQVTTSAVQTLVARLGVGAVLIDVGNADIAFGWAAFALACVAAIATAAVAAAELAVEKAQAKAEELASIGLSKGTNGHLDLEDMRGFKADATAFGRRDGGKMDKPKAALSLATKLMQKGNEAMQAKK